MPQFKHFGLINQNGNIVFDYPGIFHKCKMELKGKRIEIILKESVEKKTLSQNDYFNGIIINKYCIGNEQFGGHERDEIIEYFLDRVFGEEHEFRIKGKTIFRRWHPSLSALNRKEMSHLINTVISLLSLEFGIVVEESDKFKK